MANKSIYSNPEAKKIIDEIYDENLRSYGYPYETLYIQTSLGRVGVTKVGNPNGYPLLAFDGHKTITSSTLGRIEFLIEDCCIYFPGVIGQAGPSDEGLIPSKNYGFGKWVCEVIDALNLDEKPILYGCSYGGGIVANLICYNHEYAAGAAMVCPISITRMDYIPGIKAMLDFNKAKRNNDVEAFKKSALKTNSHNGIVDKRCARAAVAAAVHCNIPDNMPMQVKLRDLPNGKLPAVIFYGDEDYLFPAERVEKTLKKHFPSCKRFFMKGHGHTAFLSDEAQQYLLSFIRTIVNKQKSNNYI